MLIALVDRKHVLHEPADTWFSTQGMAGWATCPLTEIGALRIIAGARYPNSLRSPAAVTPVLRRLLLRGDHEFWPDDVSLLDDAVCATGRLLDSHQVTDTYLLALAKSRGGALATLDRRLVANAVPDGASALLVI